MAILPYLQVRAQAWRTSIELGLITEQCNLPYYGFIINPIPAIGTVGSFVIRAATVTPPNIYQIPAVKAGDRLVTADGYTYYATEDVQAANEGDSITIPVTPAMQATHAHQTAVAGATPKFIAHGGTSVIRQLNPQTKTLGSNQDFTQCVPYVQPWPWATDPCGVPWDQANLLALSFYAPNFPRHMDTDVDFSQLSYPTTYVDMYPVPRTMGAEYTPMTARYFAAGPGNPRRGYYGGYEAFRWMRTNTAMKDRYALAQLPTDSRWKQMAWRPTEMNFDTTTSTGYYTGLTLTTSGLRDRGYGPWSDGLAIVGSRGGRYSFCGSSRAGGGGAYSGVTIQIWQENPGSADVMLASAHASYVAAFPQPVTTGTWTGVVVPTIPGTVVKVYVVVIPDVGALSDVRLGGVVCVCESTQVPWCHHVVTGNLVAPGGLVAPFY